MKRAFVDQTMNLDLNKTAKKNEKAVEKFSPYLINSTYAVIKCDLSYPIGVFNEAEEMREVERALRAKQEEENESSGQPLAASGMTSAFASRQG